MGLIILLVVLLLAVIYFPPLISNVEEVSNPKKIERQKPVKPTKLMYTKVVGVTFDNRQRIVRKCFKGQSLKLDREKNNKFDSNAVAVYTSNNQMIGYLDKEFAASFAKELDSGKKFNCSVNEVTGGSGYPYGVNIILSRISPPSTSITYVKTSTKSPNSSIYTKKSNYYRYDDYDNSEDTPDEDTHDDNLSYEDLRPEYDEDGMEIDYSDDADREYW